jgi:hypothetical protein
MIDTVPLERTPEACERTINDAAGFRMVIMTGQ